MNTCQYMTTCPYFNEVLRNLPATAEVMKERFCSGDIEACARLTVSRAIGRGNVPKNLAPNDQRWAEELISAHRA